MHALRKHKQAGLIIETNASMLAINLCSWCIRPGSVAVCRVFKDRDDKACAYYKRMGKSSCIAAMQLVVSAKEKAEQAATAAEERVNKLEDKLIGAIARIEELEEQLARVLKAIDIEYK